MNFNWNPDKNKWLKENRNITFDEITCLVEEGHLMAILKHTQKTNQNILVIKREGYAYHVPYIVEKDGTCFLKTIYPGRVSTKKHLGGKNE